MESRRVSDTISIFDGSPRSDRAIIAFAGIQAMLGGIERWEFSKALSSSDGGTNEHQRPVAFVRERPALWYNSIEPDWLLPFVSAQSDRKIATLGNSMGGFAAILFSLILPGIRRSITFCPQFSPHPDHCPWETRWREQIANIHHWRFETCLSGGENLAAADLDHVVFCGTDIRSDVRHAETIVSRASQPVSAFLIHGCGHDVARALKHRSLLVPLLDLLIDDLAHPSEIAAYLRVQDVPFDQISSRECKS